MDGFRFPITEWISGNETLLSGVAAIVVVLSFVASPLGAGLRGLVRRWAGVVDGPAATQTFVQPAVDITPLLEPEADRPSIAVLPFTPAAKDEDSELFADGMTNDIITALGHVPGFFVTSGNSTFVYKGQSVDTRQIGRELGVRYVVEGRVRRAGDDVRVNVELVEANSGDQIWSGRFSGDLSDIFSLQDEVTQSIVGQLQPELMQAEWRRGNRTPTENLDAWTLLHSARMKYQVSYSRDTIEDSIRLAEAALVKDPEYADAHGFLTDAFAARAITRWSDDQKRDFELAADHCRKALEMGPNNPIVLLGASTFNAYTGRIDAALVQIERCCTINPNDAFAQVIKGVILSAVGRGDEGIQAAKLALQISPRDPRGYFLHNYEGWSYLYNGRHAEAESAYRASLDMNTGFFWAWVGYIVSLAMQGKTADANEAVTEAKKLAPDFVPDDLEFFLKSTTGNPTGERADLINRQVDSLREVWPT